MLLSLTILLRIWVIRFYKENAGFFLFFFVLFFGIVHPGELPLYHLSLIRGMIHSWQFLLIVLVFWVFYLLKYLNFCLESINKPENNFLIVFRLLNRKIQFPPYFICSLLLYLPVIIYSMFIVFFAMKENVPLAAITVIIFQLLVITAAATILMIRINNPQKIKPGLQFLNRIKLPVSYYLYLSLYTLHSRKVAFIVLKTASLFILNIIFIVNREDFAFSDFILVYMLIFLLHALLVYSYVRFMEKELCVLRTIPVLLQKRFIIYLVTYSILLLPELIFMLSNSQGALSNGSILLFYGIGLAQLLLFTSALYAARLRVKDYLKSIFTVYFFSSILLLSQQLLLFFIVAIFAAFFLFRNYYYQFEVEI